MILVDSHVHIYDCFELSSLLDHALGNFRQEARNRGEGMDFDAFLLLTESSGYNAFGSLAEMADQQTPLGRWQLNHPPTPGPSLVAEHRNGDRIIVVAGRQIVTAENLEVLALFTTQSFADQSSPLAEMAKRVTEAGALAAIPWGMGKWFGKRGRILSELIEQPQPFPFFLGDNGGRPFFWQRVSHFAMARKRGIPILPGSDPLPFSGEERRAGSFGFSLNGRVNPADPAGSLKTMLAAPDLDLRPYGRNERLPGFVINQIRMQLKKRR